LLIALDRAGSRYYVACDQLGSPRVVSNSTGAIVKTVEYDAFGNLVTDSNPNFALEIGFAGGLQDPASGLVHFGARDYDPAAGRWTARDPALFDGGQGNLYVYVGNDPINGTDPTGLFCVTAVGYDFVGGGVQTCITSDGASVCAEVGFGFGVTAGVDNGGLEKSGTKDGIEVNGKCGDVGVGGELSIDDTGCLKYGPTGSAGPIKVKKGPKAQVKADVDGAPKVKLSTKCSVSGKVYGKVCTQGKF
ncbi:MAG: RHS repeat domain-containing protein, partial [Myxococcaceae bacterium]